MGKAEFITGRLILSGRILLMAALGLAVLLNTGTGWSQENNLGTVTGKLTGDPGKGSLEGATVVLLRYQLKEDGQPKGGPIDRIKAGPDGSYVFKNVPIEIKTVYQLGSRIEGNLVASEYFTFSEGENRISVDLKIPEVIQDQSALSINQLVYALEARNGLVYITEIFHMENSSRNPIDLTSKPMIFPLPEEAENFEILRSELTDSKHEKSGSNLSLFGKFRPGNATIAYRYFLPVWTGGVTLEKSYPFPISEVMVLSPQGTLKISGKDLTRQAEPREIDNLRYDSWSRAEVPAQKSFEIFIQGIPVRQEIFIFPIAGFFLVMGGVLFWFLKIKLARQDAATS